ncbi:hypothetical protein [Stenotrophomonas cyclobalanopsidis]|uniref:hypothetical protein n=1 Tax=Stenotrophomonas cyclobalanopsidis TaxID=2771362 RepID=UPI001FE8A68C|nr:hypothetical protein [Stenotrophomonas cyclobalanopsidis]
MITAEGRELLSEDLAWLSLTPCEAQECRRMTEAARSAPSIDISRYVRNCDAGMRHHPVNVVNLRDVVSRRKGAFSGGDGWP